LTRFSARMKTRRTKKTTLADSSTLPPRRLNMSIIIEADCEIDASARIGTPPFSMGQNRSTKIRTRREAKGGVHIKHGVKIGAHVSIQCGVERPTSIGSDTYLNDGVRIGHDVRVGQRCTIGLNSTVSGYSEIGDDVNIAPGCTISNRVKIGDGAMVRIGSLVLDNVPPRSDYAGRPAIKFDEFKRRRAKLKESIGV